MDQDSLLASLRELQKSVVKLSERHARMESRIEELEEENRTLKIDLENERKLKEKATSDAEFLSVSYRLADNPESIVAARQTIKRLIRTIDACINLINEE